MKIELETRRAQDFRLVVLLCVCVCVEEKGRAVCISVVKGAFVEEVVLGYGLERWNGFGQLERVDPHERKF